eukprot:7763147-Ditylum_brightwellii.AAC.1
MIKTNDKEKLIMWFGLEVKIFLLTAAYGTGRGTKSVHSTEVGYTHKLQNQTLPPSFPVPAFTWRQRKVVWDFDPQPQGVR